MTERGLSDEGFRWKRPGWERAGDGNYVFLVPAFVLKESTDGAATDPRTDPLQRFYQVYGLDGEWIDELHEVQIDWILHDPEWRTRLRANQTLTPLSKSSSVE